MTSRLTAILLAGLLWLAGVPAPVQAATGLHPQTVTLRGGKQVRLQVADGFKLTPVADGMRRPRFMAMSPDNRLFVGDMHAMGDNDRGVVYVLDGWNADTGRVSTVTRWATGLRNPHSLAFHVDAQGRAWLYLALTDRLLRYPYRNGERAPSGAPQVIARFPDGGLSAANGGWHLTRTVLIAPNGKLYVSVGSSCNACIEKEAWRGVVLEMDPDGSQARILARGIRNAVGMDWVEDGVVVTNQGVDHLGRDAPDDTVYKLRAGADYGWPHCYARIGKILPDPEYPRKSGCAQVPRPFSRFAPHSSALGIAWMAKDGNALLGGRYVVALHGSGSFRMGRGYRVATLDAAGRPAAALVDGFLRNGTVQGRPCGVLRIGPDRLLVSDDKAGVIYYLRPDR